MKTIRIALIGCGKMGKEIERLAPERGCAVAARFDSRSAPAGRDLAETVDVALHFAVPESVVPEATRWAKYGKPIVIGTTGWHQELPRVRAIAEEHNIGLVYASNFSIGANILANLVRRAGMLFNTIEEYDVFLHEIHHREKLDSPSGTALSLAALLLDVVKRKKQIVTSPPEGKIRPEQLHVSSTRGGTVVGTHRVTFDSPADSLELVHSAKNRSGFALGALTAARWILGRSGVFTMDDVLTEMSNQQRESPEL